MLTRRLIACLEAPQGSRRAWCRFRLPALLSVAHERVLLGAINGSAARRRTTRSRAIASRQKRQGGRSRSRAGGGVPVVHARASDAASDTPRLRQAPATSWPVFAWRPKQDVALRRDGADFSRRLMATASAESG